MILFHIAEALKIFRRASLASIIAIISTSIAILLITLSIIFIFLSDRIELKLKKQIEINVFLDKNIPEIQRDSLEKDLIANEMIGSAKFISEEEAEKKFIEETGEDFRSVLDLNPLPASYVLTIRADSVNEKNIINSINKYQGFPGVDEVKSDFETSIAILNFLESGWLTIYIFTAVLVMIALYFVIATHKLWMISRKQIYDTMKLVGARLVTIKLPIIINGILIGLLSGLISSIIVYLTLEILSGYYNIRELPDNNSIVAIMIFTGILLGIVSSLFSVRDISLKIEKQ